jgi:hypothetical protein
MSHYYARIPTSARRTIATARGHRSTGIAAEVLTAEGGVRVSIRNIDGRDIVLVERVSNPHTGGRIGAGTIVARFDMADPHGYVCHGPSAGSQWMPPPMGRDGAQPRNLAPAVTFTPHPVAATCPATGAEYGTAE